MSNLDTLARESAKALNASVSDVRTPVGGVAGVAHATALWRTFGYAVAGAAAGAAVVFALLVAQPTQEDPADQTVPTTQAIVPTTVVETIEPDLDATPTIPAPSVEEAPEIVLVPGSSENDPAPEVVDTEPPVLEVTSPHDGEHFEKKVITFSGKTEPGAVVVASGKFPAKVDDAGEWSVDLVLGPGGNGVVFEATDAAGNVAQARLVVYLDVEPPKTTTTVAEWSFTAIQKYGSCSEPVPFDVFSGTAKPGSTVTISSEYGGGSTTADGDGKWSVKVHFPPAPYNKTFTVKVKDYTGAKKTFSFTSYYEG